MLDSGNISSTKGLRKGSSGQLLVACPTTSHKAHGGVDFGGLGAGVAWGDLSLGSLFLAFPPLPDAFVIEVESY